MSDSVINKKGVIYTCLTGRYDDLTDHAYIDPHWDYVCFTDDLTIRKKENLSWQLKSLAFNELDQHRNQRWHKLHPHILFPEYQNSLYVDTNINIMKKSFFDDIDRAFYDKYKMALAPHPEIDCVYDELSVLIELGKDNPEVMNKQIQMIKENGFPEKWGLFMGGIIYRDHHDAQVISVMEEWWWLIKNYSRRDQLSLPYVLWKQNFKVDRLADISYPSDDRIEFIFKETHISKEELLIQKKRLEEIIKEKDQEISNFLNSWSWRLTWPLRRLKQLFDKFRDKVRQYYSGSHDTNFYHYSDWSIGVYTGDSLTSLAPIENNPILSASDITDVPALFTADPFMVREESEWFLFFEVLTYNSQKGEIGYAKSSNGLNWQYQQIVISEPFHLSYPYLFKWNNEYYMIPETKSINSIVLYKADEFPNKWSIVKTLIKGSFADPSIVFHQNRWWLFALKGQGNNELHLFYADDLTGPWHKHPQNPLVHDNPHIARPAGRMISWGDKIMRFAQDGYPKYGLQVFAFEITELSPETYKEQQVTQGPILKPNGSGWNAQGMHNIDPHQIGEHQWLACVDGWSEFLKIPKKKNWRRSFIWGAAEYLTKRPRVPGAS